MLSGEGKRESWNFFFKTATSSAGVMAVIPDSRRKSRQNVVNAVRVIRILCSALKSGGTLVPESVFLIQLGVQYPLQNIHDATSS